MERTTRTVTCPHCGTERTTRAHGGIALRCASGECGRYFTCPPKRAEPPASPEPAAGGVKVKRAKAVKATAPAPAAEPPEDEPPADPADTASRPSRPRPRSHRRSWGRP